MINSRSSDDLHPVVKAKACKMIDECKKSGIDLLITSTYRDMESQKALYAQGRTVAGVMCFCGGKKNKIGTCKKHPLGLPVTNAREGQSYHNWMVAFDVVPLRYGKPVWGTSGNGLDNNPKDDDTDDLELWQSIGAVGRSCGLEWAGDWKRFKEYPHFQFTGGLALADFQKGKNISEVIV